MGNISRRFFEALFLSGCLQFQEAVNFADLFFQPACCLFLQSLKGQSSTALGIRGGWAKRAKRCRFTGCGKVANGERDWFMSVGEPVGNRILGKLQFTLWRNFHERDFAGVMPAFTAICYDGSDCDNHEGLGVKLNLVTLAVPIVMLMFLGMYAAKLPWTAGRIVGMSIALPAFLLFAAAHVELGRAFSVRAKATTLVTTGVYSRIRNPIYFFSAVMILGIIIWTGRPWLLLFLAVLIPLQVVRSRNEERVLTEKFGAEYLAYKRRTWF